jgi:hypothetical protein
MTAEQLVQQFLAIGLEQDDALRRDDNAAYNRLYRQMDDLEEELRARVGDQRRALIGLYEHPNAQVRLTAAMATLALTPEAARLTLQAICDREEYPQAADARGTIRAIDAGTFIPT